MFLLGIAGKQLLQLLQDKALKYLKNNFKLVAVISRYFLVHCGTLWKLDLFYIILELKTKKMRNSIIVQSKNRSHKSRAE